MRRLHPVSSTGRHAGEIAVAEAYTAPLGTHPDRPWVILSMVASLDGSTVVDGRSGGLGNTNDSAILARLRALADVVVVGSGTVRAEAYGPPSKPGQRIGVVTASGRVDVTTELFTSGSGFVITTDLTLIDGADGIDVVRAGRDAVDLGAALLSLEPICGNVEIVQAEGGPTLNGSLLDADLIDEIDVTTAPLAVGGHGARLTAGPDLERRFDLAQLLVDEESYLFARWRRRR